MSKFSKPTTKPDAVINNAATNKADTGALRFTLELPADMGRKVDAARDASHMARVAWVRLAIAEKLERDGY